MNQSLQEPGRERIDSIDMLRGAVMIVMALDHVRDFFTTARFDPVNLAETTPAYFLTRWITHYCAPTFIFLAGVSAFLFRTRGKTTRGLSWFLFSRGLWLAILELTVIRFLWNGRIDPLHHGAGVFWAIGLSMMGLSALVYFPTAFVGAFGVVLILTHNMYDAFRAEDLHLPRWLWMILHQPGEQSIGGSLTFGTGYCLIPWIGVMAAGYAFGSLFKMESRRRSSVLFAVGFAMTAAFLVVRGVNLYGDANRWSGQSTPLFTLLSFLNCTKYPPSLLYLLMTLGPAILGLAVFERFGATISQAVVTIGRVPLFYYVLHMVLIRYGAVAVDFARFGRSPLWLVSPGEVWDRSPPPGYGFGLGGVYVIWLILLLLLYPCCRWYAEFKRRNRSVILSYL